MSRDVGVVIVAAGRGSRFGGGIPKQFLPLGDRMVVEHALQPFLVHPAVHQIALVLPPGQQERVAVISEKTRIVVVEGGETRAASVRAGVRALPLQCSVVLIHDGARPIVHQELIDRVIETARNGLSVVPAVPVTDTLKRVDREHRVVTTIPRHDLVQVQTPQGFPRDILLHAMDHHQNNDAYTDDAMLIEATGESVVVIDGLESNIKITTPGDLSLAAHYLGYV